MGSNWLRVKGSLSEAGEAMSSLRVYTKDFSSILQVSQRQGSFKCKERKNIFQVLPHPLFQVEINTAFLREQDKPEISEETKRCPEKNECKYICERFFFFYIQILLPIIFEEVVMVQLEGTILGSCSET